MKTWFGWNRQLLHVAVFFAAATFAASFVMGSGLTLAFGPGTSGIATIIVTTVLIVIGANIVEKRLYFTLTVTLFTVLAIPTSMFGPPGIHKIMIGLLTGLTYDLLWAAFIRVKPLRRVALPLAAAGATAVSILLIFALMRVAFPDHKGLETLGKYLHYFIVVYAILGFLGASLGNWIYNARLSKLSALQILKTDSTETE